MPSVFEIIKTRWSEVLLLVGFQTGVLFLLEQIMNMAQRQADGRAVAIPDHLAFLLGLGTMAFIIVWQMLSLGFLRTAYVQGCARWEPGQLLRVGRYYFWRIVRFQILLLVVYSGLSMVGLSIAASATGATTPDQLPAWAAVVVLAVVSIALVKPSALSPAIMVGRDVMAIRSVGALREYRLLDAPAIPLIYIGAMLFSTAVSQADQVWTPRGTLHYVVMGVHHVIIAVAMLAVYLMALRLIKAGEPEPAAEETQEASEDAWS